MKQLRRYLPALLLVFLVFAAAAHSAPPKSNRKAPATKAKKLSMLQLTITKGPVFKAGQPIEFVITLQNPSRAVGDKVPLRLPFSSSQKYEIEILKDTRHGPSIWHWSKGRMFTQNLSTLELAAGQKKTFREKIEPGKNDVPELPTGKYVAVVILTTSGRTPRANAHCPFQIK